MSRDLFVIHIVEEVVDGLQHLEVVVDALHPVAAVVIVLVDVLGEDEGAQDPREGLARQKLRVRRRCLSLELDKRSDGW